MPARLQGKERFKGYTGNKNLMYKSQSKLPKRIRILRKNPTVQVKVMKEPNPTKEGVSSDR